MYYYTTHLDVLSQFTPTANTSLSSPPPPPTASTAATFRRPRNNTRVDAVPTSILGPGSTSLGTTDEAEEEGLDFARELAKGMENLMRELSAEAEGSTFQDKIKQAVNKLKESESSLQVNYILLFF